MSNLGNAGINNTELFIEALRNGTPEIPINIARFDKPNPEGIHTVFTPPDDLGTREFYLDSVNGRPIPSFLGKIRCVEIARNIKGEMIVYGKYFTAGGIGWHEQRIRDSFIHRIKDHETFSIHYTGRGRIDDTGDKAIIRINNFIRFSLSLS